MSTFEQLMLEEISKTLKQMSARLDDIASRLPMPASKNPYGDGISPKDGTAAEEHYKHPTAYRSVPTKTTDNTNE